MKNEIMEELFCVKCSKKFSNHLDSFSTTYAFKLHTSISHKKKNKLENDERANIYKRHVVSVHEGKKLFKCERCEYSFSRNTSLKRHVASVHEGKKAFNCKKCDYGCSKKIHAATCCFGT